MHVQIKDGSIIKFGLPKTGTLSDGRTVSNYDLLSADILKSEGWLPLEQAQPTYDPQTQRIEQNGYTVGVDKVTANYVVVDIPLDELKQNKIQEVTTAYQVELNGTFTSSATGTALVYDFSPESQSLWKELKDTIGTGVDGGTLPDSMLFPSGTMNITLANETRVPHTRTQLEQLIKDITVRKLQLYQKLQDLVAADGPIRTAGTYADLSIIHW